MLHSERHYNLDAYRNTRDLRDKVNSKFAYNNLLMTCYDACILWLSDLYYSTGCAVSYPISSVNVETLVEALGHKQYKLDETLEGYDRLYHTYYLVYNGYNQCRDVDINEGIKTLQRILQYYIKEIPMNNLVQLYNFIMTESPLPEDCYSDLEANRKFIFKILNLYDLPTVDY